MKRFFTILALNRDVQHILMRGYAVLLATLCGIYALSDTLQPRTWSADNELDGSYWFAFTKLLSLNQFFGRDVFFTYGPLAQYLGPVMPSEKQGHGVVVYLVALWLAGCMFICTYHLLQYVGTNRWLILPFGAFYVFLLPSLIQFPGDWWFFFLLLLQSLATYLAYDSERTRVHMLLMLSTALIALHYKFSSGIIAAVVFILAILSLHRRVGKNFALGLAVLFIGCSYLLFWLLTGSLNFHGYVYAGFIVSEAHNEIMVFHNPRAGTDFSGYIPGAAYALSVVALVSVMAFTSPNKSSIERYGLIISSAAIAFVAYKHGFLRNECTHNPYLYRPLFPIGVLVAGIMLAEARSWMRAVVTILVVAAFFPLNINGNAFCQGSFWDAVIVRAANQWQRLPTRLWRGTSGTVYLGFEQENVNRLRATYPNLFRLLDTLCSRNVNEETTITFYPWEAIYAAAVQGCTWRPMPSLQIYVEGPNRYTHTLDAKVLSSEEAPDIIVLSKRALDRRNSVSEFTNWLEPLFINYRPIATEDKLTVLVKSTSGDSLGPIVCRETGPGLFIRGKVRPLTLIQHLIFRLGSFIFKPPELVSSILYVDGKGKLRVIHSQSYYSQLAQGVYFSPYPVGVLLTNARADEDTRASTEIVKVLSANLVRNPGAYNLPVIQAVTPIHIEYCAPTYYRYASRIDERTLELDSLSGSLSLPLLYAKQIQSSAFQVHSLTGVRPWVSFGLGLPAEAVSELRVRTNWLAIQGWDEGRIAASLCFVLSGQFEPPEQQCSDFIVEADGEDHTYEFSTSDLENWRGIVTEIHLVIPVPNLTSDSYPKIKSTRLDVKAKLDWSILKSLGTSEP